MAGAITRCCTDWRTQNRRNGIGFLANFFRQFSTRNSCKVLCRIFAFNDVYRLSNLPRMKTLIDEKMTELERDQTGVDTRFLVTLSGDFLSPNLLASIDNGRSFMKCMNALGVTHCSFGNHESDLKVEDLQRRIFEFRGNFLNSNVDFEFSNLNLNLDAKSKFSKSRYEEALPSFDIIHLSTSGKIPKYYKIGLLGLLTDEKNIFRNNVFKDFRINDVIETTKSLQKKIKCDKYIAMTHMTIKRDIEFAEEIQDLLAILGGHDHYPIDTTITSSGTRIMKSGQDAEFCGIVDVCEDDHQNIVVEYRLEPVGSYKNNEHMLRLTNDCLKVVDQLKSEVIIDVNGKYLDAIRTRFKQTSFGGLICDYIKSELGADVALINGSTIKAPYDFSTGRVNYSELMTALPFPTKMVSISLPGRVLQSALRYSRQSDDFEKEKKGFFQLDSLTKVENVSVTGEHLDSYEQIYLKLKNEGILDTIVSVDGKPFDEEKDYLVALPRNLLKGFCAIQPLLKHVNNSEKVQLPEDDSFVPAVQLIVRHCAKQIWNQLGDFDNIDQDGDHKITRDEIRERIREVLNHEPSRTLLDEIILCLDSDQDGHISREDFEKMKNKMTL